MKSPYASLKEENERLIEEDEKQLSVISHARPERITWTGTVKCNLRCHMCQINRKMPMEKYPDPDIRQLEKIAKILFPTLRYLNLTRRGEPFFDPNFKRIVELCEEYGVKMDINTNGTLMNGRWIPRILPILSDVKVSIDGATDEKFKEIRDGGDLGIVLKNVDRFVKSRKKTLNPGDFPKLSFEFTLMRSNVDHLPNVIRIAHELGVDCVKAYHLFVFRPDFEKESLVFDKERYNKIFHECRDLGKELNVELKMALPFLLSGKPKIFKDRICPRPWRRFWIDFNGDIIPCCHPRRMVLGNINKDDIMKIWNSDKYQRLRSGKEPICSRCGWLKISDHKSPIPYDDAFLYQTWKILEKYRSNAIVKEKTVGGKYDVLWSRRTAQLPLP